MSTLTTSTGWIPVTGAGVTSPVSIDSVLTLTVPTTSQRGRGGQMVCVLVVEGGDARWTTNGVVPTASVGSLVLQNSTMTIGGDANIGAFRIIGVAAGASITYQFFRADNR